MTYIPTKSGYCLTSNRDEHANRPPAELPNMLPYQENGIWYPKDGGAGGSWIALKQDGSTAVLLNGAFEKHIKQIKYKQSRGLVFLSILQQQDLIQGFSFQNLEGIEPFTLIIKTPKGLFECIWDGQNKHQREKDASVAHIWSSCTLYNQEVKIKRESYFYDWLKINSAPSASCIAALHQSKPFPNNAENFMMQGSDGISTVSITSILVDSDQSEITYLDIDLAISQNFCFELNHLEWENKKSNV